MSLFKEALILGSFCTASNKTCCYLSSPLIENLCFEVMNFNVEVTLVIVATSLFLRVFVVINICYKLLLLSTSVKSCYYHFQLEQLFVYQDWEQILT